MLWPTAGNRASVRTCRSSCGLLISLFVAWPIVGSAAFAQIPGDVAPMSAPARGNTPDTRSTGPVEIAFEFNIQNIHRGTVLARQQDNGAILLDAREVVAHAGWHRPASRRAVRVVPYPGRPAVTLCDAAAGRSASGCYVAIETLATALGVVMEVDLASAVVVVRNAEHWPVVRRAHLLRERRIAEPRMQTGALPTLGVRPVGGRHGVLQLDYRMSAQRSMVRAEMPGGERASDPWQYTSLVRASTHAIGGDFGIDVRHDATGTTVGNGAWSYRPGPDGWRPTVSLGVVDDAGPSAARVSGVMIGRPLRETFLPRLVSVTTDAPIGWNYVGLVNDQLVETRRRGDTAIVMDIPVTGDVVRYDIIGWSPDGREQRYSRLVHAPVTQLSTGDVRYLASFGRCTDEFFFPGADVASCHWRAATDWRVGMHPRLTARGGMTWTDGKWQPYLGANALVGSSVLLQGLAGLSTHGERLAQWQATWNPAPLHFFTVNGREEGQRSVRSAQWQTAVPRLKGVSLIGTWTRVGGRESLVDLEHIGIVGQIGALRTELFGRLHRTKALNVSTMRSLGMDVSAAPRWMAVRGAPWWIRVAVANEEQVQASSRSAMALRFDVRLNGSLPRTEIEIARSYSQADRLGRWMLMVSPRLRQTRLTTTVSHLSVPSRGSDVWPGERSATLTQVAGGSLVIDARERSAHVSADHIVRAGGLRLRVFLDLDNDGRYDPSEPLIPHIGVIAGNRRMETDQRGRAEITGLSASEPVMVGIDSTTMPLPCWRPTSPQWTVQVPVSGIGEVDLPVRYGAILEGQVVFDTAGLASEPQARTAFPSQLTLIAQQGSERFPVDVMSDGGFYLLGLPAGRYHVMDNSRRTDVAGENGVTPSSMGPEKILTTVTVELPRSSQVPMATCEVLTTRLRISPPTLASSRSAP